MEHHTNWCKLKFLLLLFSALSIQHTHFCLGLTFERSGKDFIWVSQEANLAADSTLSKCYLLCLTHGLVQVTQWSFSCASLISSFMGLTCRVEFNLVCRVIYPSCRQVHIPTDQSCLCLEAHAMKIHKWQQKLNYTNDYNALDISDFFYNFCTIVINRESLRFFSMFWLSPLISLVSPFLLYA